MTDHAAATTEQGMNFKSAGLSAGIVVPRAPADRTMVNLDDDWEAEYWANKFDVTREELARAVRAADSRNVQLVRKQLEPRR